VDRFGMFRFGQEFDRRSCILEVRIVAELTGPNFDNELEKDEAMAKLYTIADSLNSAD
jgi:hypothetical protein